MNKILFLDRDGVINLEKGVHTFRIENFHINQDIPEALKAAQDKGYLLVVITNQSGIAKGMYTHDDVSLLHDHLKKKLSENGVSLTEIYYCPHHPDHGKCLCRKPGSLLLEKALARYNSEASKCIFIGDRERDQAAGNAVGVKTFLIPENSSILSICRELP
jgi:D-glycero-D-manno-heptose 1,7-bisphosphate phosphatase